MTTQQPNLIQGLFQTAHSTQRPNPPYAEQHERDAFTLKAIRLLQNSGLTIRCATEMVRNSAVKVTVLEQGNTARVSFHQTVSLEGKPVDLHGSFIRHLNSHSPSTPDRDSFKLVATP